jgi:hypothetical protein
MRGTPGYPKNKSEEKGKEKKNLPKVDGQRASNKVRRTTLSNLMVPQGG